MTPLELYDKCVEAIHRYENGDADSAFVRLVLRRPTVPQGRSIKLFGRFGPTGRLDIVRERDGAYEAVALFDAVALLRFMRRHIK